jgi:hypothetical protein
MEWIITIKEEQYVQVVTSGIADKDGSMQMAQAIGDTMRANLISKALIDHSGIDAVSGEIVEIYERPKEFQEMKVIYGIMIAEVVKPEHEEFFSFLETVSRNRGFKFEIFHDRNDAVKWLLSQ